MVASKYILYAILCFYIPTIYSISDKYSVDKVISKEVNDKNITIDSFEIQIHSKRLNNNLTVYIEASERVIIIVVLSVVAYLYFAGR